MSTIFLMIAILGGTFGFMSWQRRKLGKQYSHMRAGELAPRLGMTLVEGNPEFNLATQSVQPSVQNVSSAAGFLNQMAATSVGGTLGEFRLHMTGQPYGANAELVLYCRQDYKPGYAQNVTTTWHDLRLTIRARGTVTPFDLRLRKETTGLETRRAADEQRMPVQSFGDPMLDQRFAIETYDPSLPKRIAAVLGPLSHHMIYVHITGAGDQVSFVMTPASVMAAAMSFEQVLHVLASIGAVLDGTAVPGALP